MKIEVKLSLDKTYIENFCHETMDKADKGLLTGVALADAVVMTTAMNRGLLEFIDKHKIGEPRE